MSKKADRLLDRICRMETKLETLKCEYNMLLCKEDHDGDLAAFAQSMSNDKKTSVSQSDDLEPHIQSFVLVPPSTIKR